MLLLQVGCGQEKEIIPSGKSVKIGVVAPFSGDDRQWGENGLLGVKAALLLEEYLVNGDKIELVTADDQNSPDLTVQAVERLVLEEEVAAVLLLSGSSSALALADLATSLETPIMVALASHPEVTNSPWISQLMMDDKVQGTIAALYVLDELLIDRAVVFKDLQDPHALFLTEEFLRKYLEAGGAAEVFHLEAVKDDLSSVLEHLKTDGYNFVYAPLDAAQVLLLEKTAREVGWNPLVMGADGLLTSIILQHREDLSYIDGLLATDIYASGLASTEYGKKVSRVFKKTFSEQGTSFAALGSEGTSILIAAMNRCPDNSDKACINRMLRSDKPFVGMFGKIYIGHDGKAERPIFVNVIDGTKMISLVKIY